MKEGQSIANFPNTRWTLVQRAVDKNEPGQTKALEELCRIYWPPVYAFVRSKGRSPSEAEDLTQGFFQQLLQKDDFGIEGEDKGKLRTFLLSSMQNFLRNDHRDRNRLKRGGDVDIMPLHGVAEEHYSGDLADSLSPEQVFDRHWVLALLDHVIDRLEKKYEEGGKGDLFREIKVFILHSSEPPPRKEVAERIGIPETHLNMAVHRLRKQYRKELKAEIEGTLLEGASVDEELQHLFGAIGS